MIVQVWVYRCSVYAYPWYTSVRTILDDPAYSDWFVKFKEEGPWFSPKCDNNFKPPKCSDYYHMQEQTPGYPTGDGDCAAPGCDCGKHPCGFYLWNHSSTTIVKGQTFRQWFIEDCACDFPRLLPRTRSWWLTRALSGDVPGFLSPPPLHADMLNKVGMSPLVSGFFWDEYVSVSAQGHRTYCVLCLADRTAFHTLTARYFAAAACSFWPNQESGFPDSRAGQVANDTGLEERPAAWQQVTDAYNANMEALRVKTLAAGKFGEAAVLSILPSRGLFTAFPCVCLSFFPCDSTVLTKDRCVQRGS
eukprot:SAG22_NODE_1895_length_3366_cov_3.131007_2_plen_304_part_00